MDFVRKELAMLKKVGLCRSLRTVESATGPRVRIGSGEVILLCSNDYLGLANHPKVKEAAVNAIKKYGFGSGASRLVSGTMTPHMELEERLAAFKGVESALLFNSGYAANTGVIPAIAGRGDLILSDKLNHASIVDGCMLSHAEVRRYHHSEVNHIERLLTLSPNFEPRTSLLVTDGVFSMDGDIAPLNDIVRIAKEHGTMIMVDDAHGTGVLGEKGRGTVEHLRIDAGDIDIHMGTLGKALGAFGAYIAGSRELIEYLVNRARPFIYSTAIQPSTAAAVIAALDIVEEEPERRDSLKEKAKLMREGLRDLGFDTMESTTHIIPVLAGESEKAVCMMDCLFKNGVFAQAIRPPSVPAGTARIRVTVTAGHSREDLEKAIDAFRKAGKEAAVI